MISSVRKNKRGEVICQIAILFFYSKPNCMQCNFTKQFFENNNVEFTVKDVFESEEALAEVKELGFNHYLLS